jgi:hypothetical protein
LNGSAHTLIIDMSTTTFCDVAGVHLLERVYQRAQACGTELRLMVTAPIVRRVLTLNGLHRIITIYPSVPSACPDHGGSGVERIFPASAGAGSSGGGERCGPGCSPPTVMMQSARTVEPVYRIEVECLTGREYRLNAPMVPSAVDSGRQGRGDAMDQRVRPISLPAAVGGQVGDE